MDRSFKICITQIFRFCRKVPFVSRWPIYMYIHDKMMYAYPCRIIWMPTTYAVSYGYTPVYFTGYPQFLSISDSVKNFKFAYYYV